MKHYDCHTCLKAHIHKDQATTRQQTDFACKSNQWKHDTLKWNQHRTCKYQKNNLTCFGFITYKYPGRHSRYQQHQNRCHYRDKQRIHKRSYVIQFLKRILIVFKCECSFRRKSQHICKNPLGRLKRIHNQNINRKQKNASKNKSCYSISDFFLHYISTSLRFVITNCVTPIPATIIRKTIAFACAKPNSFAPKAEL